MQTVLEIVTEALEGVGVDAPTSLVSGDDLGKRCLAIANALGQHLATRYEWEELRTEGTFTTTASQELQATWKGESSDFPYARKIVDNTFWNRSTQRRVFPLSQRAWARIKSENASPATEVYYVKGNQILFPSDTVVGSQTIAFEYIDSRWAQNASGTAKRRFTANDDEPRLDDHMFVLGVRWRYMQSIGMEYGEDFRDFQDYVQQKIAEDQPRETLSLNPNYRAEGYDSQVPEGNWNQ